MTVNIRDANVTDLRGYWSKQRDAYKPRANVLLLCGEASELERETFAFVVRTT